MNSTFTTPENQDDFTELLQSILSEDFSNEFYKSNSELNITDQHVTEVLFEKLSTKIIQGNFNDIVDIINLHPSFIFKEINNKTTPLEIAFTTNNTNIIYFYLNKIENNIELKNYLLHFRDDLGNNIFHLAVVYCDAKLLFYLVKIFPDIAELACKTFNDLHKIPIELIGENPYSQQHQEIFDLLLRFTLSTSEKSLLEPLNFDHLNKNYQYLYNAYPYLYPRLKKACHAVNMARSIIKSSDTHPDANNMSIEDADHLNLAIDNMRDNIRSYQPRMGYDKLDDLDEIFEMINKKQIGNCNEYSILVRFFLTKHYQDSEIVHLVPGNHVFVLYGRNKDDPNNKLSDITTWNKDTLVIDAWGGEIYLADEIPHRLHDFRDIEKREKTGSYNATPFFSLKFQKIEPYTLLNENIDSESDCENKNNYGAFSELEFSPNRTSKSTHDQGFFSHFSHKRSLSDLDDESQKTKIFKK